MNLFRVFCDAAGRRNLPGICWYSAKCTGHAVNQGGTADCAYALFVPDREYISVRGVFLF